MSVTNIRESLLGVIEVEDELEQIVTDLNGVAIYGRRDGLKRTPTV